MPASKRFAFGQFVFEPVQHRLTSGSGQPVQLTPRLASALQLFLEHPGELLEKERMLRELWPGLVVEENNLNQVISALRRTLGKEAQGGAFIQTVPRRGYRFVVNVLPLDESPASLAPPPPVAVPVIPDAPPIQEVPVDTARPAAASSWTGRRTLLLGALAAGSIAAGSMAWWGRSRGKGLTGGKEAVTMTVLPFDTLGGNEVDQLLALGTADSLIASLSTVPGLVVKPLGAARQASSQQQDPVLAARSLGTAWVLHGTLQRDGSNLRVAARLVRASDGTAQWSESFTTDYTSMFDVQDKLAKRVLAALSPLVDPGVPGPPSQPTEQGGTRSARAYQLYLTARWRAQGTRAEDFDRAVALLTQALRIDPRYAIAWTELAHVHRRRLWGTDTLPSEIFTPAEDALQAALEAVPDLPQAHAGRGFTRYWFDFD